MVDAKSEEVHRRIHQTQQEGKPELDLTDLGMKTLPEALGDLTHLRKLDLSGNRLQEIPAFLYGLTDLEELDLGNNRLSRLEQALGRLTRLVVLDLSENRLTVLPEEIGALTQLRECHLYANRLKTLPESLCRLQSLALLDAARNRLNYLPLFDSRLANLEYLDLSWNRLQSLPTGLAALTRLRCLDVGHNLLHTLGSELFSLTNLEELYLEHNDLTVIPAELAALPHLWALSIKGNPYSDLPEVIEQRAAVTLRKQASKIIKSSVAGGPKPGRSYFDKPASQLEIRIEVRGLPATEKTLDLYYKHYKRQYDKRFKKPASRLSFPVTIKYPDGSESHLNGMSRKKALRLVREHQQDLETGTVLLNLGGTIHKDIVEVGSDFALESAFRVPEVKLESTQPPSPPTPSLESEPAPACYLSLEGQEVKGTQVKCGTAVDVVFGYGQPPIITTLAQLKGINLQQAILESADLGITLIPRGFTFRDGGPFKTAKFRHKKLEEPVRFFLQANAEPLPDANLYFCFDRGGIILYEFNLAVAVVMSLDTTPSSAEGLPLNLDLDEVINEQIREGKNREAILTIWGDGEQLRVNLDNRVTGCYWSYDIKKITRTALAAELLKIQNSVSSIGNHKFWSQGNPLDLPPSKDIEKGQVFQECLMRMASAGFSLFHDLSEDKDFEQVLQDINNLSPGSRLTIHTDCAFAPWEILYPKRFHFSEQEELTTKEPVQIQDFWGYRFEIECLFLTKTGEYCPIKVRKAHKAGPLVLSFNLNPTIDDAYSNKTFKPVAAQAHWFKEYKPKFLRHDALNQSGKEIALALNKNNNDATLLYLYCHGQSEKPFSANAAEKLEVDKLYYIEPDDLDEDIKFIGGPIVFMNSCSSGAFSSLSFSTFLSKFRAKQALGILATSFPVPGTFAAAFGWEVIKRYFNGEDTLGKILLHLRRELLNQKNPLGLFYALQCPMDITAPSINKEEVGT